MFFNDYINLITESFNSGDNALVDKLKFYQSKIINLHKQINIRNYQEVYPDGEATNLNSLLANAVEDYKRFVNSHMDNIMRSSLGKRMYEDFAHVLKSIKV